MVGEGMPVVLEAPMALVVPRNPVLMGLPLEEVGTLALEAHRAGMGNLALGVVGMTAVGSPAWVSDAAYGMDVAYGMDAALGRETGMGEACRLGRVLGWVPAQAVALELAVLEPVLELAEEVLEEAQETAEGMSVPLQRAAQPRLQ